LSAKKFIAGIDFGTSKIRCLVFDINSNIIFSHSTLTPIIKHKSGFEYHPANEIWNSTKKILKLCFKDSIIQKGEIKSIACSSVGESGIPIDNKGKVLFDPMIWYDPITNNLKEKLLKKITRYKIYNHTGLNSNPFFSAYKILWIKKNKPKIYKKIFKWLSISDYISWKLTGVIATDYSQAMRTLLFNAKDKKWSNFMFNKTNINKNIMPEIMPTGSYLGIINPKLSKELNLNYSCVVGLGGHDHFVGTFGLNGYKNGKIIDSLGSSESITVNTNKFIKNKNLFNNNFISGVFVTPNRSNYYVVASILTSSLVIEWYKSLINIDKINKINKINKKNGVVKNIFTFPQFRYGHSPTKNMSNSRGALWGLDLMTTKEDIYVSIMECLCFDSKHGINFIIKNTGQKIKEILCSGGASRNKIWAQIRADVLNKPIKINRNAENVSLGTAIMGALAAKIYKDEYDVFQNIKLKNIKIRNNTKESKKYNKIFIEKYLPSIKKIDELNNIILDNN